MQKIPTLFRRDSDDLKRVRSEVNPVCAWVLAGEGTATRKYDGTCVLLDADGAWWARREVKPGRAAPAGFRPEHELVAHATAEELDAPRDHDGLRDWLLAHPQYEGLVWHHPDGRMAKLKRRDFA